MSSRRNRFRDIRNDARDRDYPSSIADPVDNGEEEFYRDLGGKLNYIANYNKGLLHHLDSSDVE